MTGLAQPRPMLSGAALYPPRYRVEERQHLAHGAYRHLWHDDYGSLEAAAAAHCGIVAYDTVMRTGLYGPSGPRRLVVTEVTR